MPTSSQALILQTSNGQLPPLFGKQCRKSCLPVGLEWTTKDEHITKITQAHFPSAEQKGPETSKRSKKRVYNMLKRTGTTFDFGCKLDFGTLPQVLSIRGIHGSMAFDKTSNALRWKVNSIGPFYEQNRSPLPKFRFNGEPAKFRYFHADRIDDQHHQEERNRYGHQITTNAPKYIKYMGNYDHFRRKVPFHSQQENMAMPYIMMNRKTDSLTPLRNIMQIEIGSNEYVKLIPSNFETGCGTIIKSLALFELEKCSALDVGAFRLIPTNTGEYGDFKLTSPSGIIHDQFRLCSSLTNPTQLILLESDGTKTENYTPLFINQDDDHHSQEDHVELNVELNGNKVRRQRDGVFAPREAWVESQLEQGDTRKYVAGFTGNTHDGEEKTNTKDPEKINSANDYFHEITQTFMMIRDGTVHVEPPCNNSKKSLHENPDEYKQNKASDRTALTEDMKGFSIDQFDSMDKSTIDNTNTVNAMQYKDWSKRDFDRWSRTSLTQTQLDQQFPANLHQNSDTLLTQTQHKGDADLLYEKSKSILNNVKFNASYRLWKKKKISTVRMRKELPPSDPYAVCVKVEDGHVTHNQMKSSIEAEIGCKLTSLQFDPVLINSFQGDSKYRWILRFSKPSICEALCIRGIHINGIKCSVRRFDDVMREEHDAHNFYQMMKSAESKTKRKPENRLLPSLNIMNTTEAQTSP